MLVSRREMMGRMAMAAGAGALSPFLMDMKAHAAGKVSALPKRFVFLVRTNGLRPYGIDPVGMAERIAAAGQTPGGGIYTESLRELELNDSMAALDPIKSKVNIYQGLTGQMCTGMHQSSFGALGAYRVGESDVPTAQTIDLLLAKQFPSIFSHLGLALFKPNHYIINPRISAGGPGNPISFYADPMGAYKDLFGAIKGGEVIRSQKELDADILDFVMGDIKRVERQLPGSEREKMGYYLEAFESMRQRDIKLAARAEAIKSGVPDMSDKYTSEHGIDRLEAHFEMAAAALITGLTRVTTIKLDYLDHIYTGLGLKGSVHGYGHNETSPGRHKFEGDTVNGKEAIAVIRKAHFELMSSLAQKLDAVPEGDGTMLDNTLIVMLSDSGDKHHSNYDTFPMVTAGGMGGKFKTGQYLQYSKVEGGGDNRRSLLNFYHSVLHAAGLPDQEFGQPDRNLPSNIDQTEPLAELMA